MSYALESLSIIKGLVDTAKTRPLTSDEVKLLERNVNYIIGVIKGDR